MLALARAPMYFASYFLGVRVMLYKLESLRGIAACLVVLFHSPFMYGSESLPFIANSYLFVDFFFILSGFVMSIAYYPRIQQGLGFKEYSILRLGRVYPLHVFVLFLWIPYILIKQYLFESGFGGQDQFENNNVFSFITNLFLINSFGINDHLSWNNPAWSIGAEVFSYFTFFWFTLFIDKKRSLLVPFLISLVSYSFLISLDRNNLDITYDYGFIRCLAGFYAGIFISRFSDRIKAHKFGNMTLSAIETLCIVLVVFSVSIADHNFLLFIPVIISFSIFVLIFSQKNSGIWGNILLSPPLKKIGLWSYSIYMIHTLILAGTSNIFEHVLKFDITVALGFYSLIINSLVLMAIIIASKYSYQLIEKVFRDKSRELARKSDRPPQQKAGATTD